MAKTILGRTEQDLVQDMETMKEDILHLKGIRDSKNIMVTQFNTIIAIKLNNKITHILSQKDEKEYELKMLVFVDKHLTVPRFKRTDAEQIVEMLEVSDPDAEKVLISERDLANEVIHLKEGLLDSMQVQLDYLRKNP